LTVNFYVRFFFQDKPLDDYVLRDHPDFAEWFESISGLDLNYLRSDQHELVLEKMLMTDLVECRDEGSAIKKQTVKKLQNSFHKITEFRYLPYFELLQKQQRFIQLTGLKDIAYYKFLIHLQLLVLVMLEQQDIQYDSVVRQF